MSTLKVYLSKSFQADPDVIRETRKELITLGYEVIEQSGMKWNPTTIAQCNAAVFIAPSTELNKYMLSSKEIYLGKGQAKELELVLSALAKNHRKESGLVRTNRILFKAESYQSFKRFLISEPPNPLIENFRNCAIRVELKSPSIFDKLENLGGIKGNTEDISSESSVSKTDYYHYFYKKGEGNVSVESDLEKYIERNINLLLLTI